MNASTFQRLVVVGLMCGPFGWPAAQGADPVVGIWVLSVAKSRFSAGSAPQSETRTFVMEGQQTKLTAKNVNEPRTYLTVRQEIKATSIGVDGDGKLRTEEWTIVYDGKDRAITGDPDADVMSTRRVDPFLSEFTKKRAGQAVITGTCAISRDGRTMTIASKGINAKGQTIDDVAVLEKQ
jgi:hypothetical protein